MAASTPADTTDPGSRPTARWWGSALLAVVLLVGTMWTADPAELAAAIQRGTWEVPAAVAAVYTWIWAWRVVRLRALLPAPVPWVRLAGIDGLAFGAVNVLPARVGEILWPWLLTTRAGQPWGGALSAWVLTRVFDLLGLGVLVTLGLALGVGDPTVGGALAAALLVGVAVGLAVVDRRGVAIGRALADRGGVVGRLGTLVADTSAEVSAVLRRPRAAAAGLGATVALWLGNVASVGVVLWIVAPADATWPAAVGGFLGIIVGILVAPTPGGVGSAHAGGVLGLTLAGVEPDVARGVILMLHAYGWLHTAAVGLACALAMGLTWQGLRAARAEDGQSRSRSPLP